MNLVPVISQTLPSMAAGALSALEGIRDLWNPPSLSVRLAAIHFEIHDLVPYDLHGTQILVLEVPSEDAEVVAEGSGLVAFLLVVISELVEDFGLFHVYMYKALPDLDLLLGHVLDRVAVCKNLEDI